MFQQIDTFFQLLPVDYSDIVKRNDNLRNASPLSTNRNQLLSLYLSNGYDSLVNYYAKTALLERAKIKIKSRIPQALKRIVKRHI